MATIPIIVLAGQSNAARAGIDNRLHELLSQSGGAFELVKVAMDGATIFPHAGIDWDSDTVGELFSGLVDEVKAAIQRVLDAGHTPQVVTLWAQGEADTFPWRAPYYEAQLAEFIEDYRGAIGQPDSAFYISLLAPDGLVRQAQLALAERLPFVDTIETNDLALMDKVHYDKAGREAIAERLWSAAGIVTPLISGYRNNLPDLSMVAHPDRDELIAAPFSDLIHVQGDRSVTIHSFSGDDHITTGAGNDIISTQGNVDWISAGAGDDIVDAGFHDDILFGGAGNDQLIGGPDKEDGIDHLDGGTGADLMAGGGGNDTYIVDDAGDLIVENPAAKGRDHVTASVGFVLPDGVEDLTLAGAARSGTGNGANNIITGTVYDDMLAGRDGHDALLGDAGDDRLAGELGMDRLEGGADDDFLDGGDGADHLDGGSGTDRLDGGDGNDRLDGGLGADTMVGGLGNDVYFVDQLGETVIEAASGGTDFVWSSITQTLAAEVEALILTGSAAIDGTGNALDNNLTGNAAANVLNGGAGADIMTGGLGDDLYVVDNGLDRAIEWNPDGGTDSVRSTVSYALRNNVENLTLTGSAAIDGSGNGLDNVLTGNAAANVLDGWIGADRMIGGGGNDVYVVRDRMDEVVEAAGGGIDRVHSFISHALAANVENLTLAGSGYIGGIGNALANSITGNAAANLLNGGAGADRMAGGAGNDTYIVEDAGDLVVEAAGEGRDSVQSSITLTLADNVEALILTGSAALAGTGNALNNVLTGNGAANVLDGGGGADTLAGGLGNDLYVIDNTLDRIVEAADAGTDTVESALSYAIGANLENLTLTGDAAASATGNSLANTITGNAAANVIDGGLGADTMRGGAGDDTYIVGNPADQVVELAGGGIDTVRSFVSHALSAEVETLILAGSLAIEGTGNALANRIVGNKAANLLDGGAGADTMEGGQGHDIYAVDDAGDVVIEAGATGGRDTVRSAISYTLGTDLEYLVLTGSAAIDATGNALGNLLVGNAAANVLDGGAGGDTMSGGTGNDLYIIDNRYDRVTEASAAGVDTVESAITHLLGENVERLTLTGSAAINATGNGLDNILTGNAASNILDGGLGADTMIGGGGNDTYYVGNGGDRIIEAAGGGIDTIRSVVSHALSDEVERLVLGGSLAINGTGNALANVISGNAAANVLNGGAGADTLNGGLGDDVYVVDDAGDVLIDAGSTGGRDSVQSSVSFVLGAYFENLTLTGSDAINGVGNFSANLIIGNEAANILNGAAGADTMRGGLGDDTYVVDNANDVVIDAGLNGGIDSARSSISFTLDAYFENLTLTGGAAVNGTGNWSWNRITGNAAANTLMGHDGNDALDGGAGNDRLYGGEGNDSLQGGLGRDSFWFSTGLGADNVDRILDFSAADDAIGLNRSVFKAISADGTLAASAFRTGTAAQDADDRILYDQAAGNLFYDADGAGAGAAILFAQVTAGTALTHLDLAAYTAG